MAAATDEGVDGMVLEEAGLHALAKVYDSMRASLMIKSGISLDVQFDCGGNLISTPWMSVITALLKEPG